ncbi:MAG: hypothetical protein CM1200mP28_08120 [Deltaproteobacteria bacterium]|nr:MAG: hypothetical protein CM1200mP28_08120 [Deltaproteobacteria bacterium]
MLKTKNFGRKSLNEIKVILTEMGLSWVPHWKILIRKQSPRKISCKKKCDI